MDLDGFVARVRRFLARLERAFKAIPGWFWVLTLLVAVYPIGPANDLRQYFNAAASWPEPFLGSPLEGGGGESSYGIFLPWAIPFFLPLALIPPSIATALLRAGTLVALYLLTGRVFWKALLVCLSAPGLVLLWQGNLDALVALGLLLPASGGLLLLSIKPQVAALAALPLLQRAGWKHALFPALVVLLSTLLWPEWLMRVRLAGVAFGPWDWNLFPWGVPFGFALLVWGIRRRDPLLAALATPLVSPFLPAYTLAPDPCPALSSVVARGRGIVGANVDRGMVEHPTTRMRTAANGGRVSRAEWRWVLLLGGLLLLLTALPLWVVSSRTPEGWAFSGLLLNGEDSHSYLAKMRQGYRGELFTLPYSGEAQRGVLIYPLYLGVGALGRWLPVSLLFLYHATRLLAGALLLGLSYYLIACVISDVATRRWAWLLVAAGSGLGLFAAIWGIGSVDLWLQEAFTLLGILANPHFSLSIVLQIALLLLLFAPDLPRPPLRALALFAVSLFLALTAPFLIPPMAGALLGGFLAQLRQRGGRWGWGWLWQYGLVAAGFGLVAAYDLYLLRTNPSVAAWSAQNVSLSPPPRELLLGLGALFPLALLGAWTWRRRTEPLVWALWGWLLMAALLVYAPINLQRRVLGGVQVPLGILAGVGVTTLLAWVPRRRHLLVVAVLMLLLLPTDLLLLQRAFTLTPLSEPMLFYSDDESAALEWLRLNAGRQDVLLASAEFSNFVPALSDVRVVHGHLSEVIRVQDKDAWVLAYYRGELSLGRLGGAAWAPH